MIALVRILCTALVGGCFALCAGPLTAAAAQTSRAVQTEGVFAIGIPTAAQVTRPDTPSPADAGPAPARVQGVWDLGAAGDWGSAQNMLRALESSNPSWQAPSDLKTYLVSGRRDQRIRDALADGDWTAALAQLPALPPSACDTPFHLWARADALEGLGSQDAVNDFYVRSLSNCPDPAQVAALAKRSVSVLDLDGLASVRGISRLAQTGDPAILIAYVQIVRAEAWQRFETAVAAGDLSAATALAEHSDDPRLLTQAGWTFLEPNASAAAGYFERALEQGGEADARRGLVMSTLAVGQISLARRAVAQANDPALAADLGARVDMHEAALRRDAGDWTAAISLASSAARRNPDLAGHAGALIAGAYLAASSAAYDTGDFAGARRLALQAADHPSTRRAALMRAAWSDLQLEQPQAAAAAFSRLYLEVPDAEAGEGYALAADQIGDLDTAAALARTLGGPLGANVQARYAAMAFNQGDYLTARAHAPDAYDALEGVDGVWFRQAVSARRQGGTPGENQLRGLVSTTSAGTSRGLNRFEAGISLYTLDAGTAQSPSQIAEREAFAAPFVAWSREGATSLAARIGLLPVGAESGAALTAEVAVAREVDGRAVEVRAFIRPKTDSVLAMAGETSASGDGFGRVTETGARLSGRLPVSKSYAVQAGLSAAVLEGENAADNEMVSVELSASRSLRRDGFAYLVTGPFYQYQSYDRNTNFFTPGHGGYFSPQAFHRAGWSMNAQTDPLKNWIAKADFAVAHESVEEKSALANPLLAGPQPRIGGSNSSGISGALDLAVARRVTTKVILSANASAIASQAFNDVRIGMALTWVPGGRAGLVRLDLPTDPFNPGAWIQP